MSHVSFACMHCAARLKGPPGCEGKVLPCPKCRNRTVVPDKEEAASYGLAGEAAPTLRRETGAAPRTEPVSPAAQSALTDALVLEAAGAWRDAVSLLGPPLAASSGPDGRALRIAMSRCLAGWAAQDLGGLGTGGELSAPMRKLLRSAAEKQKWGGSFDTGECGLCGGRLRSIVGRPSVRTTVGTAYLCCARPTADDARLAGRAGTVWRRLSLAVALDGDNEAACRAMGDMPAWHAPLRVDGPALAAGDALARWDDATDGLLGELAEEAIKIALEGMISGFK